MAKKIGDLLKELLTKAGIDLTKDEVKKVLEIGDEIPDDIADAVNKALLTVTAAQSHPDVIKKVKAEALNGVDKKLEDLIAEMELEVGDDFKTSKNSFDKIGMLTKLAKAAGEKKSGTSNSKDKTEWAEREKEYNRLLKEEKEGRAKDKTEYDAARENDKVESAIMRDLSTKNYIFPKDMDADVKLNTAYGTIKAALAKHGHAIKRNEHGQLVILNKDGNQAYSDTNVALEPKTFIDGVLAQNKLLLVTKEDGLGAGGAGSIGQDIIGDGNKGNLTVANEIAQELKALDA